MGRNLAMHIPNNTITTLCDIPDNTTGSPVACRVDDPVWSASTKSESEHELCDASPAPVAAGSTYPQQPEPSNVLSGACHRVIRIRASCYQGRNGVLSDSIHRPRIAGCPRLLADAMASNFITQRYNPLNVTPTADSMISDSGLRRRVAWNANTDTNHGKHQLQATETRLGHINKRIILPSPSAAHHPHAAYRHPA